MPADGADPPAGRPRVVLLDGDPTAYRRLGRPARDVARRAVAAADLVHLHGVWTVSNLRLAAMARGAGLPYLLTVHGMLNDWAVRQAGVKKRIYLALFARRLMARAARVQLTADPELAQARPRLGEANAIVLPYLFDVGPFADPPPADLTRGAFPVAFAARRPKVLFLSRLHVMKGVERLIDAAAALRDRGVEHDTLIAGPGEPAYVADLKRRVAGHGLADRVHFLGMVAGDLKLSLYAAADLFALPTYRENFGLVLPEAMACGTAVVTTRGVDIWPELQSAGAAILDPDQPVVDALADAVAGLLSDPADLKRRGERGRAWVFDFLHPDRLAGRYLDLYAEVAGAGRR